MIIVDAGVTWPATGEADDGEKNLLKIAAMRGYSLAEANAKAEVEPFDDR